LDAVRRPASAILPVRRADEERGARATALRSLAAASPIRYHAAMSDLRFAVPLGAHCRGDAHAAFRAR